MNAPSDCLRRFTKAVRDGKRGDFSRAREIVEAVRKGFGEKQAEIAKKELWAAIRNERWDNR